MDIKSELKEIILNGMDADKLVEDVARQQEELLKKSHLLKVISVANKMEKFVADGVFSATDVKYLELECLYITSESIEIEFNFLAENTKSYIHDRHLRSLIKDTLVDTKICNKNFVSEVFYVKSPRFEFKIGIGDEILDVFLSDDLKKIYEYSKMEIELTQSSNQDKKLKI